jgi:hypothetical protein
MRGRRGGTGETRGEPEGEDMRVRLTVAVLGIVLGPALGRAADKSQATLVNPLVVSGGGLPAVTGPVGTSWTNGTSKGKTQGDAKCNVSIQLGKLTGIPNSNPGDETTWVICISDAQITVGPSTNLNTSLVTRGLVKKGTVKIKANLLTEGTGCGPGQDVKQYSGRTVCYEPDPAYNPALTIPFVSDPNQGVIVGGFAPRPASNLIAIEGIFIP